MKQELYDELKIICSNDISHAAFSGMVFNALRDSKIKGIKADINDLIVQALDCRVAVRQMNNFTEQSKTKPQEQNQSKQLNFKPL